MTLALPTPIRPHGALVSHAQLRTQLRAYRHWQSGQTHADIERWPLAASAFGQAATLHDDPAYTLAAAHAFIKSGHSAQALHCTQRLRQRHPNTALAYTLESHALLELGRAEEAVQCLRNMPMEVPRDNDHLVSLAVSLQRCKRHEEAIRAFFDALALKMDDSVSHFRLGMSFKDMGMKVEAAECVRTAVVLGVGTSDLAARAQLMFLERETCRWAAADEVMAALRPTVQSLPPHTPAEVGAFPYAVLVNDPLENLKVASHYALHAARHIQPLPPRLPRARQGRLRIGYLSADFHEHATSQLMAQMLESHDRSAFEVALLSNGPNDHSAMRQRISTASEHFEDFRGRSFESMARRVRELRIDLLIDLKGATFDTLLPVLAYRAAPLQVSWLGFPGSTGAPYIDYLVGDPIVTPLENAAHFSEKIAQLPQCYQPNDARRALPKLTRRADWGAPEDALLLCAFHQSYKISAEVFAHWCGLLQALPRAVLWLMQWNTHVQTALTAAARQHGIAPERLVFAPLLPLQDHLSRLATADIYLDAWPCNAHTTASEALWCGVPVVTLQGATFAQRVAASLLHAVALPELVCSDEAHYQSTVLSLATDPARRAQLKTHLLAQRSVSPLFNGATFAGHLEALYQRMWERCLQGLPAAHLPAASQMDI
jgi:predicted O-linked N-acetylglucosamine transferase (SPINDLY family)